MRSGKTRADDVSKYEDEVERCGALLRSADIDVAAFCCTTGSLVEGQKYDARIERKMSDAAGVPAVATAASIKRAFDILGIESVSIVTPYIDELNKLEEQFLADAGYDVLDIDGLGLDENNQIGRQSPRNVYQRAKAVDRPDADGIFISCTNYRTFDVIELLESDVGKPVVTSNQATLWNALDVLGLDTSEMRLGELFNRN